MEKAENFEIQAIVELFGHTRMAGVVTEQNIGGASFIRIDVPETTRQPSFTRMVHPNAVYAINPVTEDVMKGMAETFQKKPIESWDLQEMRRKLLLLKNNEQSTPNEDADLPFDQPDY